MQSELTLLDKLGEDIILSIQKSDIVSTKQKLAFNINQVYY